MKISKTQIKKRKKKKTNPGIVKTIELAEKNNLIALGKRLSSPKREYKRINLYEINKMEGNKFLVVGKVLGFGDITKKISVSALAFSKQAKEKLESSGCQIKTINQEIESNPKLKDIVVI